MATAEFEFQRPLFYRASPSSNPRNYYFSSTEPLLLRPSAIHEFKAAIA
ncbi:Disease resistance protein [Corchorus olitorius]|uniref:Disease resistance protein n=1 Tax=Corchorus olitorius TaxID=93759 RepID=A0A1R3KKI6_9ROSI|nr:Disease resistance protein [Corchorus olitorius]